MLLAVRQIVVANVEVVEPEQVVAVGQLAKWEALLPCDPKLGGTPAPGQGRRTRRVRQVGRVTSTIGMVTEPVAASVGLSERRRGFDRRLLLSRASLMVCARTNVDLGAVRLGTQQVPVPPEPT